MARCIREKKVGHFPLGEYKISLVDPPGAYALSPVTEEEKVVRAYFLKAWRQIDVAHIEFANRLDPLNDIPDSV